MTGRGCLSPSAADVHPADGELQAPPPPIPQTTSATAAKWRDPVLGVVPRLICSLSHDASPSIYGAHSPPPSFHSTYRRAPLMAIQQCDCLRARPGLSQVYQGTMSKAGRVPAPSLTSPYRIIRNTSISIWMTYRELFFAGQEARRPLRLNVANCRTLPTFVL